MTDRELLEAAAKAAGVAWNSSHALDDSLWVPAFDRYWDPLTDDGDAMRLAVALCINIELSPSGVFAGGTFSEAADGDLGAATRRAIVRAAAAMVTP